MFQLKVFQTWIDLWIEPTHIIKTNSIMAKLKRKIITWSNFEWKNSYLPTILRVFSCRKNAKNSSDHGEAELCSFQTLKRKNYRLVNNGLKLLDFNPCCLVIFTKIIQGRLLIWKRRYFDHFNFNKLINLVSTLSVFVKL